MRDWGAGVSKTAAHLATWKSHLKAAEQTAIDMQHESVLARHKALVAFQKTEEEQIALHRRHLELEEERILLEQQKADFEAYKKSFQSVVDDAKMTLDN